MVFRTWSVGHTFLEVWKAVSCHHTSTMTGSLVVAVLFLIANVKWQVFQNHNVYVINVKSSVTNQWNILKRPLRKSGSSFCAWEDVRIASVSASDSMIFKGPWRTSELVPIYYGHNVLIMRLFVKMIYFPSLHGIFVKCWCVEDNLNLVPLWQGLESQGNFNFTAFSSQDIVDCWWHLFVLFYFFKYAGKIYYECFYFPIFIVWLPLLCQLFMVIQIVGMLLLQLTVKSFASKHVMSSIFPGTNILDRSKILPSLKYKNKGDTVKCYFCVQKFFCVWIFLSQNSYSK